MKCDIHVERRTIILERSQSQTVTHVTAVQTGAAGTAYKFKAKSVRKIRLGPN